MVENCLTIDVEEYFQVANFSSVIPEDEWDARESRLPQQMDLILNTLKEHDVKITFFVLGWIAERHKDLIRRMHQDGHEIASHGYGHRLVYEQSKEEFREDVRKAKGILEGIVQDPVLGYRAPSFSISMESIWALDVLSEEGYAYDSSVFPIHRDRGGIPGGNRFPYQAEGEEGRRPIWEFPISTLRLLNQNIPYSGGGYFRLLPYAFIKPAIKSTNGEGHAAIIYLHPWEFDPEQPRVKAGIMSGFRHYVNLAHTESKLKRLLSDFKFQTMRDLLAQNSGGLK